MMKEAFACLAVILIFRACPQVRSEPENF